MSQNQDVDAVRIAGLALVAIALVCATIVTSCEMQNRAMVEISRINERAAEKGLEPFVPNPLSPVPAREELRRES